MRGPRLRAGRPDRRRRRGPTAASTSAIWARTKVSELEQIKDRFEDRLSSDGRSTSRGSVPKLGDGRVFRAGDARSRRVLARHRVRSHQRVGREGQAEEHERVAEQLHDLRDDSSASPGRTGGSGDFDGLQGLCRARRTVWSRGPRDALLARDAPRHGGVRRPRGRGRVGGLGRRRDAPDFSTSPARPSTERRRSRVILVRVIDVAVVAKVLGRAGGLRVRMSGAVSSFRFSYLRANRSSRGSAGRRGRSWPSPEGSSDARPRACARKDGAAGPTCLVGVRTYVLLPLKIANFTLNFISGVF